MLMLLAFRRAGACRVGKIKWLGQIKFRNRDGAAREFFPKSEGQGQEERRYRTDGNKRKGAVSRHFGGKDYAGH
jgi:hypothetical protein